MTQREFVKFFKEHMGKTKTLKQSDLDIKGFFQAIEKVFTETEEDRIIFPGFGVFHLKLKPERIVRHPMTGEKIKVPKRNKILFKVSQPMETRINKEPVLTAQDTEEQE